MNKIAHTNYIVDFVRKGSELFWIEQEKSLFERFFLETDESTFSGKQSTVLGIKSRVLVNLNKQHIS
ncbi:MAG: hypothetical protein IJX48_01730 [Paludibacteraceae bacterium]|nr:hypothetical protein [Paludibacteraceae bacterium]